MVNQSRHLHVLLTRPHSQNLRFARQLRAFIPVRLQITCSPLLAPVILHPAIPAAHYTAVIFTSETGVAAAGDPARLPRIAYCVGDQTARAAHRAGYLSQSAAGYADDLIHLVSLAKPAGPLLHICGAETRGDVAERLTLAGVETHRLVAYRQERMPLSPRAHRLLAGIDPVITPLFSPRTANFFAEAAEPFPTAPLYVAAFSPAVAAQLRRMSLAALETADQPSAASMLATIRLIADKLTVA